jgi:hypothetical protein
MLDVTPSITPYCSSDLIMARLQWFDTPSLDAQARHSERRRSPRLLLHDDTASIILASDAGRHVRAIITDVSREGLGTVSPVELPIGSMIAVKSSFGFALGSIQRCEFGMGVYRCGIILESCVATRTTITHLIRQAETVTGLVKNRNQRPLFK